jgi:DNA polymerase-3 subunit gamma/tau
VAAVRRAWPEVLERLRELRKAPWTFIKDNTEPMDVTADVLVLGVRSARLRDTMAQRDDYTGYLQQAIADVLGRPLRIETVVQPGSSAPAPAAAAAEPAAAAPATGARPERRGGRSASSGAAQTVPPTTNTSPAQQPVREPVAGAPDPPDTSAADPDDAVLDEVSGADLLTRELGASIIDVVDET